ncbi:hypothetical protein FYK55_16335 [Roseiconus nitratireducens]|uniref:Uncharacterized protein n=1 Tax=Roseiconus nitratireducens TaxID=2605748 RepID=A0A5M6D7F1_9BACT|nr:hypothetical protein [Roseiconus nitratireducens]KAA5541779.1 hypothetical protein FYK55_16335 [Roseiconus nitratireducens]
MRIAILLLSFLPFLYYASKDNAFHFRGRRVTMAEHLLHLAIGVTLFLVFAQAVLGNLVLMTVALILFLIAGAVDEYVWHRGIPAEESDLHAKEHLALLIFVVVALVVDWLDGHQWTLPPELSGPFGWESAIDGAPRPTHAHDWWRAVAFPAFLLPYAYYGLNDNLHHFRHRAVSWNERLLHVTIVLALLTVISHAIAGHTSLMLVGLVLFLSARSADEWIFHRRLHPSEIEQHAKTHFAFLGFLIAVTATDVFARLAGT